MKPSIGLHPRDTDRLVSVLLDLKDLGNTVIVVEHEEGVMQAADQIVDMGPEAGSHGGEVILSLSSKELEQTVKKFKPSEVFSALNPKYKLKDSHTFNFLKGMDSIEIPARRRPGGEFVELREQAK